MARITLRGPGRPRPNTEGEERETETKAGEERETGSKGDEDRSQASGTPSSHSGVRTRRYTAAEKGKGKAPVVDPKVVKMAREVEELVEGGLKGRPPGITIKEPGAEPPKGKTPVQARSGRKRKRAFAVRSNYSLRSGLDLMKLRDGESDEEDEDEEDIVDEEEVCNRIGKDPKSDDDDDDDPSPGPGPGPGAGGAHTHASVMATA